MTPYQAIMYNYSFFHNHVAALFFREYDRSLNFFIFTTLLVFWLLLGLLFFLIYKKICSNYSPKTNRLAFKYLFTLIIAIIALLWLPLIVGSFFSEYNFFTLRGFFEIIASALLEGLFLLSLLIIPFYSSLHHLFKSNWKRFLMKYTLYSVITGLIMVVLANVSAVAYSSITCASRHCQPESGLLFLIIGGASVVFFVIYLGFSVLLSVILILIKKGYWKYFLAVLALVLIAFSYSMYAQNRPVSFYLQRAIDREDIKECDNYTHQEIDGRDLNSYIPITCKTRYIILKKLGASYCKEVLPEVGSTREDCSIAYAFNVADTAACDELLTPEWNFAASRNYCRLIQNMKSVDECSLFDEEQDTETYYSPKHYQLDKKACMIDYAVSSKNPAVCEKIMGDERYKASCYQEVGMALNDASICDKITQEGFEHYQSSCKRNIIEIDK